MNFKWALLTLGLHFTNLETYRQTYQNQLESRNARLAENQDEWFFSKETMSGKAGRRLEDLPDRLDDAR